MTDARTPFSPQAETLFADFLARRRAGEAVDLADVVRRWPGLESELRRLAELYERPQQATAGAQGAEAEPSSELLRRLRAHRPKDARYTLQGEVARGGMGAILRVWDEDLRRTLAMKVVLGREGDHGAETPNVDAKTLGRFLEEAQITGQLDHPGIVPVHELGLGSDGRVFFTMRLVKGRDLKAIFDLVHDEREGWSLTRALGVILKVCEALSYAHKKGVIHRDLKPANVMVGEFGEVYVMDWGLARVLTGADAHDVRLAPADDDRVRTERDSPRGDVPESPLKTMDGDVVGTPSYMPPEQARGQLDALGPHSDVYSVGAMLYHLIAGEMPYVPRGERVRQLDVLMALLARAPRPISELAPRAPAELLAICEKAMQRDPARRYRDTQELGDDLRAYLERRVVRAYETGTWAETRKWVQRNKPLALAFGAAGLAALTGAIAFALKAEEAAQHAAAASSLAAAESAARLEATERANDVLSLSAQADLDALVARAERLWPAHPQLVPEYERWLAEAREIVDGLAADPGRALKRRPSLAEHKANLAKLRAGARPATADVLLADRQSHPRAAELSALRSELLWRARMLGLEPWPDEAVVQAELDGSPQPTDPSTLNMLLWAWVDMATPVYGKEMAALLFARRAVAGAQESERSLFRDSLAWANFRVGRLDQALREEATALAEPKGQTLVESAAQLEAQVARWRGDGLAERRKEQEPLAARVEALERIVGVRRTFDYDDPQAAWWDRLLDKLVGDLERLQDPERGLMNDTLDPAFGWGVAKRLAFARSVEERTVTGVEARRRWGQTIADVRGAPRYGGLELEPQLGLLPIGFDPESELYEFAHLQTGEPARRGADGQLVLTEATGLVFVLIPGSTFLMGAQAKDPRAPNYDPRAFGDEGPVHEVELGAYFISKYEMTQAQWQRIAAVNPSTYRAPSPMVPSLLHPVEQVNWRQARQLMDQLGLELPSEARWEHAARGGTDTPWWTGADRETLRGIVNLADQTAARKGAVWSDMRDWPDLEDGGALHMNVGHYPPNPFGLHETAGNVWEWCLDGYAPYTEDRLVDPLVPRAEGQHCTFRGGAFTFAAIYARSSGRNHDLPTLASGSLGVRPALSLQRR